MVLADISNVVGNRYARKGQKSNPFCALILDEFGQYAANDFEKFITTARDASVGCVLSYQSNAQLKDHNGTDRLASVIRDTASTRLVFRQSEEADSWAKLMGTEPALKRTDQLEESDFFTESYSKVGSLREVEEFVIHPNTFKSLKLGQVAFRSMHHPSQVLSTAIFDLKAKPELNFHPPQRSPGNGLNLRDVYQRLKEDARSQHGPSSKQRHSGQQEESVKIVI